MVSRRYSPIVPVILAAIVGCSTQPEQPPQPPEPTRFEDFLPKESSGRRPAGTREDPFIGDAVIMRLGQPENGLTRVSLRHRAIPYLKQAMETSLWVRPELVEGISDGDFVSLHFERVIDGTETARIYRDWKRVGPTYGPIPYIWFGYELFRIERIPDDEYRARHKTS